MCQGEIFVFVEGNETPKFTLDQVPWNSGSLVPDCEKPLCLAELWHELRFA